MGNLQAILNVIDFGMTAQAAVIAPRFAATSNIIELSKNNWPDDSVVNSELKNNWSW